jgi:hypothetical protein
MLDPRAATVERPASDFESAVLVPARLELTTA